MALVFLMFTSFFVAIWQWKDFLRGIAALSLEKELSMKLASSTAGGVVADRSSSAMDNA